MLSVLEEFANTPRAALLDDAQQGLQNAISDLFQPWSALTPLAEAAQADVTDVVSAIAAVFGIL
ncbi:hypothetical protein H7K14_04970 [Mycolicibacter longobardus]|uniref:hypothetical protein n=1 Tax=Mycolicibacter longobardus TaxID=1108812 RepID=UPI0021F3C0EE|nr:hypothetical protein [Mycolicibacter longobardus]MCV7383178.1 hypothetical protein [Mycolicibacter longobardus]